MTVSGSEASAGAVWDADELTGEVLDAFAGTSDERFGQLLQALVRHLHAFAKEVELTEEEWAVGIDFLTRTGHWCDEERQEFILLSDVLGLSMLTIKLANPKPPEATEPTVFGPFFVENSPEFARGEDIAAGAAGAPCWVEGQVRGVAGEPVGGARLEVWQADETGHYDVQYADRSGPQGRGHLYTDEHGRFWFWTVRPRPYPIPDDGPVGQLMTRAQRSVYRPAHLHFMITADGYERLVTHVFDDEDDYLDRDAVFGVRPSLLVDFEELEAGSAPDGRVMQGPYHRIRYDFVLAPVVAEPPGLAAPEVGSPQHGRSGRTS